VESGTKTEGGVQSIQRALKILLCFTWEERELRLTEIAERIGLSKSTVSRLLSTLEREGFLVKDPKTSRYKLGHSIYYLGLIARESLDLRAISHPIMTEITHRTQETTVLYLLDKQERICFDQVESPQSIKRILKIGDRFPLWSGATGKAILAQLDEPLWYEMQKQVKPITPNTIVDPEEFIAELRKIKRNGFAISMGETNAEVGCVAAPIFDEQRSVIGCVSISGPTFRFPSDLDEFCRLIADGARRISKQLGYYEKTPDYLE